MVLVANTASNVPDSFRIAADGVVEVGPALPRHIVAAAKLCLKVHVTPNRRSSSRPSRSRSSHRPSAAAVRFRRQSR